MPDDAPFLQAGDLAVAHPQKTRVGLSIISAQLLGFLIGGLAIGIGMMAYGPIIMAENIYDDTPPPDLDCALRSVIEAVSEKGEL